MAQDKYQTMGDGVYAHIGGPQNVAKLIHCMTRVRLTIKDEAKVDQAALKKCLACWVLSKKKRSKSLLVQGLSTKSHRPWLIE